MKKYLLAIVDVLQGLWSDFINFVRYDYDTLIYFIITNIVLLVGFYFGLKYLFPYIQLYLDQSFTFKKLYGLLVIGIIMVDLVSLVYSTQQTD